MLVVVYKVLAVWNDNSRNWTKSSQISGTMMAAHCMTLSLKLALNWSELSAAPIDITALHWLSTSPLCLCCQWHWSHLKGFQFIPIERRSWTNSSNQFHYDASIEGRNTIMENYVHTSCSDYIFVESGSGAWPRSDNTSYWSNNNVQYYSKLREAVCYDIDVFIVRDRRFSYIS